MRVLLVLLSLIGLACSARILAVLPFPAKSHSILQYAILRLLAQRGHEVVTYTSYPPPNTVANLTYIHLPTSVQDLMNTWTFEKFQEVTNDNNNQMRGISELATSICEDVLKNQNIRDLLESDQTFDLVFLEATLGQESLSVFSHKFKAPIINIQTVTTWSVIDFVAGNSLSISYIPKFLSLPLTNKMSFKERLQNLLSAVFTLIFYNFKHLPKQQRLVEQYYNDSSMPHVSEMLKEIAITLINSQRTLEYSRPYTPNMIPIGGAHMSSHMTPLPQDIKTFVDTAKEGFIFFSLGTIIPAHIMPSKYMQAFVDAFQKLPQKVLWKIELESISGLSENVMLTRWVPQPTVLNHSNCVLFLTHGGLFSQHEALYAGIPVLGVPFTDEQRYNLKFNEHLGVGMKLELADITEESVYKAIRSVIKDPRYKENAKRVSSIVRDQPMSPADTVVYWVEYVLRHGGASYLKPDSVNLRWFELLLLDVVLFIFATLVLMVYCVYYISIPLYSCFCWVRRVSPEALSLYNISLLVLIIFIILYTYVDKIFNLFNF